MLTVLRITKEDDHLIVEASLPVAGEPVEHAILVPLDAIADRMSFYNLASAEEAVQAILREHYKRLNGGDQRPGKPWRDMAPAERGAVTGGLDKAISVGGLALSATLTAEIATRRGER